MVERGAMRPLKKILGAVLLSAGIGLVIMPDRTAEFLCGQKIVFGLVAATAGYFLFISGRRM